MVNRFVECLIASRLVETTVEKDSDCREREYGHVHRHTERAGWKQSGHGKH